MRLKQDIEHGGFVMGRLKERGVYLLPDGREVIALSGLLSGHFLYSPDAFDNYQMPEYEVDSAGRLRRDGEAIDWCVGDLSDTGRSAGEPEKGGLADFAAPARL